MLSTIFKHTAWPSSGERILMSADEATLLNNFYEDMSIEELQLLNDEDESLLEERELALANIRHFVAKASVEAELSRHRYQELHARYDAIERNVKALRRRRSEERRVGKEGTAGGA